jgi:hypothetical protein
MVGSLIRLVAGRIEDVASEAGVSYSALYAWGTGRRRPSRPNLEELVIVAERRSEALADLAVELRAALDRDAGTETD